MKKILILLLLTELIALTCNSQSNKKGEIVKPNIIVIYLDDLGYGDLSCYGATEIETPNIDKLAEGGVRFTNGYASSATCTPSRYPLLTGEYPWRNRNARILSGSAPLIIDTTQMTIPKLLKEYGYSTGIVGKWHLGLGNGNVDWNKTVSPGPNQVGFDYSFIMAATQDRVPTVYIEDGNVVGLEEDDPIQVNSRKNFEGEPTGKDNPELLRMKWHHGHNGSILNGISRIGFIKGGEKAIWVDENMADTFLGKAKQYVQQHKDAPFFLYYALQQPHVPRTPNQRFVGLSGMGPRGDAIVEADWCIGEFINTLRKEGILDNTLIIFSSDNGPVLNDGYYDDAVEKLGNHTPWGPLRGGKYSLFEAGTRVPFVVYWNGKVSSAVSDAMVSQIDILSSLAELVGSNKRSPDGQELLNAFMGKSKDGRKELILEAGSRTALRKGDWAMIPPYKGTAKNNKTNIELGNSPEFQLYHLSDDIGQQKNQAKGNPKKLNEMIETFQKIKGEEIKY